MLLALYNGGAHLDFRAKDGATALHKATVRGGFKSVEKVFQLGGSPDMRDSDGTAAKLTWLEGCSLLAPTGTRYLIDTTQDVSV